MRRPTARNPKLTRQFRWRRLLLPLTVVILVLGGVVYYAKSSIFWQQKWRRTVVITSNPVMVVSVPASDEEKLVVITFPRDVYVEVPHGYGWYRLGAVERLSELEKRPELFTETIEDLIGIKVAGWVRNGESDESIHSTGDTGVIKQIISPVAVVLQNYSSNLSFPSLLHLSLKLAFSRPDTVYTYETEADPRLFVETQLPDKTKTKQVDRRALDTIIEQTVVDPRVRIEGLRLEIRNTSKVAAVGNQFARFLTNQGGTIINVGNEVGSLDSCLIRVNPGNTSKKIIQFVKEEFGCETADLADSDRADAVILLGTNFGKRWLRPITIQ